MGVRHLDTFVREIVPNGCFEINIEDEIRTYFDLVGIAKPPAPVIVIDLMAMYQPLSNHDKKGLFCGGRFNVAYSVITKFFTKLSILGAQLIFFVDGPVQDSKSDTWCKRQDERYCRTLKLFHAIEQGADLETMLRDCEIPTNFDYPLRLAAQKFGEVKVAFSRECDQELAAFATNINALAILSDDSDFLIYEGSWKYWSTRDLDLSTLSTIEYNRSALLSHLKLSFSQMPILATLAGNDIMPYEAVCRFHSKLGSIKDKFPNLAECIRQHYCVPLSKDQIAGILKEINYRDRSEKDLLQRFHKSLNTYRVHINTNDVILNDDLTLAAIMEDSSPFMYKMWDEKRLDVSIGLVDMRPIDYESQISLILRMSGIILFHRKPHRPNKCEIVIKLNHQGSHRGHTFPVQYPQTIEPPTLPELLDKDPAICEMYRNIKYQLLAWIASDTLNPSLLQNIPRKLQLTIFTLYYLVEQLAMEAIEADLFLQVAYDVAYETYDMHRIDYPVVLKYRPFRLAFLFQEVYSYAGKAFRLVGLNDDEFRDDPPFDGVQFHNRYDDWCNGQCDLEQIRQWRIYDGIRHRDRD